MHLLHSCLFIEISAYFEPSIKLFNEKLLHEPTNSATGKHPRGLYVLFFTEMWERFGYYLMIGIFFLYLTDTIGHGGRGLDIAAAISIVGTYVALIYLTPFIGGLDCRQVSRLCKIHFS